MNSYQLLETKKWVPAGMVFKQVNGESLKAQEASIPQEKFDTKEEADNFLREYFIKNGYIEIFQTR